MEGPNVTNIFIINGKELSINNLSKEEIEAVRTIADKAKYIQLRNHILKKYGNEITCTIKIDFPNQEMHVYDSKGSEIG